MVKFLMSTTDDRNPPKKGKFSILRKVTWARRTRCIICYVYLFCIIISKIFNREFLPRIDNYRLSRNAVRRPSMGELHGDTENNPVSLRKLKLDVIIKIINLLMRKTTNYTHRFNESI